MTLSKLGIMIKKIRTDKLNISQTRLAKEVGHGATQMMISRLELGHGCTLEFFFQIIKYLKTKNMNFYNILSLPYIDIDHFDLLFDVLEGAGLEGGEGLQRKEQISDFIANIANTHAEDLKRLSTLIDNI